MNLPFLTDPPILANASEFHEQDDPHSRREPSPADEGNDAYGIRNQTHLEIVGEVSDESEIQDRVNQTSPDLLAVTLDDSGIRPEICETVLNSYPGVRNIAVPAARTQSVCYWASFHIQSKKIDLSREGILRARRRMPAVTRRIL